MLLDAISKAGTIALGGHVARMGTVLVPAWDCITMSERIFLKKRSMFIWKSFRIH